jgi:hypothetical protein
MTRLVRRFQGVFGTVVPFGNSRSSCGERSSLRELAVVVRGGGGALVPSDSRSSCGVALVPFGDSR